LLLLDDVTNSEVHGFYVLSIRLVGD